jgi:hypothetical protein
MLESSFSRSFLPLDWIWFFIRADTWFNGIATA